METKNWHIPTGKSGLGANLLCYGASMDMEQLLVSLIQQYLSGSSHFDSETYSATTSTDIVAVNGPLAWRVLEEAGYQMNRCYPVEALRYQYLNTLPVVERSNNFHSDIRIVFSF